MNMKTAVLRKLRVMSRMEFRNRNAESRSESGIFRRNGKTGYGATTYVQVANAVENQDAADGKGYGTGAVTYRLTDNALGAQIDEKSGY